jgi:hypothetical protein
MAIEDLLNFSMISITRHHGLQHGRKQKGAEIWLRPLNTLRADAAE